MVATRRTAICLSKRIRACRAISGAFVQAPWIVRELARRIATLRPEIAIAAHPGPFDLVMLAALRRNRVRVVVVVHDADAHPGDGMPMRLWLQRKLIRRADAVVALSEHVAAGCANSSCRHAAD